MVDKIGLTFGVDETIPAINPCITEHSLAQRRTRFMTVIIFLTGTDHFKQHTPVLPLQEYKITF